MSAFLPSTGAATLETFFLGCERLVFCDTLWYSQVRKWRIPSCRQFTRESQSFCSKSLEASCWYVGNCWRQPTDFEYAFFHDLAKTMEDFSTFSYYARSKSFWEKSQFLGRRVGCWMQRLGFDLRGAWMFECVETSTYFASGGWTIFWMAFHFTSCLWCSWTWANVDGRWCWQRARCDVVALFSGGLPSSHAGVAVCDAAWRRRVVINLGGIFAEEWRITHESPQWNFLNTFKPKPIPPNKIRGNPGWWFREIPIYYTPFAHQFGGDIFSQGNQKCQLNRWPKNSHLLEMGGLPL